MRLTVLRQDEDGGLSRLCADEDEASFGLRTGPDSATLPVNLEDALAIQAEHIERVVAAFVARSADIEPTCVSGIPHAVWKRTFFRSELDHIEYEHVRIGHVIWQDLQSSVYTENSTPDFEQVVVGLDGRVRSRISHSQGNSPADIHYSRFERLVVPGRDDIGFAYAPEGFLAFYRSGRYLRELYNPSFGDAGRLATLVCETTVWFVERLAAYLAPDADRPTLLF